MKKIIEIPAYKDIALPLEERRLKVAAYCRVSRTVEKPGKSDILLYQLYNGKSILEIRMRLFRCRLWHEYKTPAWLPQNAPGRRTWKI